ncbi:MAG: 1-acyl-sn-glycerol-3-phosphate acyltransferase, partial [Leptospiraceae bacterium]|nr:1-acyl-sn-glycerol-3-phosphate acyltransferase [Leptospiraceae bacterium]
QLSKGIIVSIDLIPLNRKASDQKTFQDLKKRLIEKPAAIGIFPEGTWFRGFRKSRKMFSGVAILSKRYALPIVPIYMDAYNMNKEIKIIVGDILEGDKTKKVGEKICELYEIYKRGLQYV